jgi:hypothetical protein
MAEHPEHHRPVRAPTLPRPDRFGRSPARLSTTRYRPTGWLGVAVTLLATPLAAGGSVPPPSAPTIADIVGMTSIDSLLAAPDGHHLAFRTVTPDLAHDHMVVRWFSLDTALPDQPIALGAPAEPIFLPLLETVDAAVASWAPDSRSLFVLGQAGSQIQVHRLGPDGTDIDVTRDAADVVDFTMADDGRTLRYLVRRSRQAIADEQARASREGLHFDRGFSVEGLRLTDNHRIGGRSTRIEYVAPAAAGEAGRGDVLIEKSVTLTPDPGATVERLPRSALASIIDMTRDDADRARLSLADDTRISLAVIATTGRGLMPRYRVEAVLPDGSRRTCPASFCTGSAGEIHEVAVSPARGEVVILHEADYAARIRLYGWTPRTGATRLIVDPHGALDGGTELGFRPCPVVGGYLLCVHADPTTPPRLVQIAMASGAMVTRYNPNETLERKRYPPVRLLRWHNADGHLFTGVLMTPPDARPRLPLVINTSKCRGFLRGGSGLLAPEPVLADMGIVALCLNDNNGIPTVDAAGNPVPLVPHKALMGAEQAIIDILAREGLIDPSRVGVTGHSFGAIATSYAISHSRLFAAAVTGTGTTIDPEEYLFLSSTPDGWRDGLWKPMGLPAPRDDPALWRSISPAHNAAKIDTALLMLPPESEYLLAVPLFKAMRDAGKPVDMFVFPNEGHVVRRQPSHIYWRYRRTLNWFACWLQVKIDHRIALGDQLCTGTVVRTTP